jgi:hypothetical protein
MNAFQLSLKFICLGTVLTISSLVAIAAPLIVPVHDLESLYAAVNDPANIGATLILNPGTYLLSVNDPSGDPRPNRGRLELQEDMSLIGVNGDRNAVVIDAINLPPTSYQPNIPVPLGAIRVGRGRNSIEWMTVQNAQGGQSNIVTGLAFDGIPHIRIAHIGSTRSLNSLSIFNFGPGASGKTLEVDIIENEFYSNSRGLRQGFRIGNFSGATGSVINVRMHGNQIWGNQFSLIVNNGAIDSTINVTSSGNMYYDNGNGLVILGGLNANGNTVNFYGHGDRFLDNNAGSTLDKGGLVIVGGENLLAPNGSNNNTVNVHLWGCRMSGNELWDLAAIGARSAPESLGSPGVNNHVTVTLNGTGTKPLVEFFANSIPADPTTTNSVTVIR